MGEICRRVEQMLAVVEDDERRSACELLSEDRDRPFSAATEKVHGLEDGLGDQIGIRDRRELDEPDPADHENEAQDQKPDTVAKVRDALRFAVRK